MKKRDEPVFPQLELKHNHVEAPHNVNGGLTKREYFAAMAMQGIICGDPTRRPLAERAHTVRVSIQFADALLAELEKDEK